MSYDLNVKALSSQNWDDLLALFGKSGGYGHCWCMPWRISNKQYVETSHDDRRILLKTITDEKPDPPGLIGYVDNQPVAWCGFSPRTSFERLNRSRNIKPIDEKEVWSIVCFFIHKNFRGKNIISELIAGAIEYAKNNIVSIIEAYPIELSENERLEGTPIWYGTKSIFTNLGFKKVGNTKSKSAGKVRIIMRYYIESRPYWPISSANPTNFLNYYQQVYSNGNLIIVRVLNLIIAINSKIPNNPRLGYDKPPVAVVVKVTVSGCTLLSVATVEISVIISVTVTVEILATVFEVTTSWVRLSEISSS